MGTEHDAWSRAGASAARRGVRRRIAARGRNCRPHFELARKQRECGSAFVCYSTTPLPLLPRPGSRPPTLDSRLSTGSTGCPNQCAKHKRHRTRHCPTKSPITCRGENLYSPSPLHSCPNHLLRSKKSIQRRSTRGIVRLTPYPSPPLHQARTPTGLPAPSCPNRPLRSKKNIQRRSTRGIDHGPAPPSHARHLRARTLNSPSSLPGCPNQCAKHKRHRKRLKR